MNMNDLKKALAAILSAALVVPAGSLPAFAAEPAAVFQGIEASDDSVSIRLSAQAQYNSFLTQTPPRLVLELIDVKHEGPSQSVKGKGAYLSGVRTSQFERAPRLVTRVVMDLVKMAGYKIVAGTSGLTVQLVSAAETDPGSAAQSAPAPAAVAPEPVPAPAPAPVIVAKRAKRAAAAPAPAPEPVPVVTAAAPAPAAASPMAAAAAAAAVVEAASDKTPRPKLRPISAMQALRRAGLDQSMNNELAASAQSSDVTKTKVAAIDAEPETMDPSSRRPARFRDLLSRLPRDPVTLDFDNTDIRDVIRLLAAKSRVNIVFGPDVNGTLTLHLTRVPFSEAFRTALSMMKLTTDQVGDNILRVITPAELARQRTSSSAITRVFVLNYAKAGEVKSTVDSVRQAEGRSGSSASDVKTNSLVVTDSLEGLQSTENLIAQLDQRPRQVLIEAKLVELSANNTLNYGVQWDSLASQNGYFAGQQGSTYMGTTATPALSNSNSLTPLNNNANLATLPGAGGRGTGVNLAADRVFGAFTLGRVTNSYIVNATLTAAASLGKAKILSDPKVATLNNQAANINVTTQIPYVTSNVASTGVQTQTVSYVTTGIQLTVTPSINADGRITLDINPSVSQPSVTAAGSTQTGAPAVDSRNAKTTVLVRDGETIVIGGLISDSMQDTISKVPLLGDIPILGWLFKKRTKSRVRNELLIFVTTRILPD